MELVATAFQWIIFIFIVIFLSFYFYVKSIYRYYEKTAIPYEKPTFPFGNYSAAALMKKSLADTIAEMYTKYRGHKMVGSFNLWRKQMIVRDPKILKQIFIKDFEVFPDRGFYYNKEKDPLSSHLVSLDGEAWKLLRAKLSPTFSSGKLKGMHSIILDCSKMMTDYLKKHISTNSTVDCQSLFNKFTHTVIAATAFGIDINCFSDISPEYFEVVKQMSEPTTVRMWAFILMFNYEVAKFLNARMVPESVSKYFMGLFNSTIELRKNTGTTRNDYIQLLLGLLKYKNEGNGVKITVDDLAAQAFGFIVAGSETTSSVMAYCLFEISQNPEIQERLFQELDVLPDVSYDNIHSCEYLDMVVSEALRRYPPAGFVSRKCSRDYQVPGTDVVIEKGTQVIASFQGMHNDPDYFPNPEVFDPERFSKENKGKIKPDTYIPFGEGPRYCIGMRYANAMTKTGLATILRKFEVSSVDSRQKTLKVDPKTFITSFEEVRVKLKERNN